jgi:hypothetical protein
MVLDGGSMVLIVSRTRCSGAVRALEGTEGGVWPAHIGADVGADIGSAGCRGALWRMLVARGRLVAHAGGAWAACGACWWRVGGLWRMLVARGRLCGGLWLMQAGCSRPCRASERDSDRLGAGYQGRRTRTRHAALRRTRTRQMARDQIARVFGCAAG